MMEDPAPAGMSRVWAAVLVVAVIGLVIFAVWSGYNSLKPVEEVVVPMPPNRELTPEEEAAARAEAERQVREAEGR